MTDLERLAALQDRLRDLDRRLVTAAERPIHEVARAALSEQIGDLGRAMVRRSWWIGATPPPANAAAVARPAP